MKEQINKIKEQALKDISTVEEIKTLNDVKVKYLGKKGELTSVLRGMGSLLPEERPIIGSLVNEVREEIEQAIKAKEEKNTVKNNLNRFNARNTFEELLNMGAIPIVNENDTVATYEIEFGDNDHLSAYVAALTNADLLILLSDIDGMYTDDPSRNPDASLIPIVWELTEQYKQMGKSTSKSELGTGGMSAKLDAAKIAVEAGIDMVIANGSNVRNILDIVEGKDVGTLFVAHRKKNFDLLNYIE